MDIKEFVKAAKHLLKVGTKKQLTDTINVLLIALNIRNMYYMDMDNVFFTSYPKVYQTAFLKICELADLTLMLFDNGRWIVHNKKVSDRDLQTDSGLGKALDFPCGSGAMDIGKQTDKKLGVNFRILTEYGDITVTSFICFKKERAKVLSWLNKKKKGLLFLKSLKIFTKMEPYLYIESYTKMSEEQINVDSTEKIFA